MNRLIERRRLTASAVLVAIVCGWALLVSGSATAQDPGNRALISVEWYGPYGITRNDTTRFNYANRGIEAVTIQWAFTNAGSGDVVCSNFGRPTRVEPGKGAEWDFSQTIDSAGAEVANCGGTPVTPVAGETYFDITGRHEMIAWIFIQHLTRRGLRNAVDLPSVEIFDSMPGSTTPARTLAVIARNPSAPTDWMVPSGFMLQPGQ